MRHFPLGRHLLWYGPGALNRALLCRSQVLGANTENSLWSGHLGPSGGGRAAEEPLGDLVENRRSEAHEAQPQCVADHRDRAEAHGSSGDNRAQ
jgi:hypothetical protein